MAIRVSVRREVDDDNAPRGGEGRAEKNVDGLASDRVPHPEEKEKEGAQTEVAVGGREFTGGAERARTRRRRETNVGERRTSANDDPKDEVDSNY